MEKILFKKADRLNRRSLNKKDKLRNSRKRALEPQKRATLLKRQHDMLSVENYSLGELYARFKNRQNTLKDKVST